MEYKLTKQDWEIAKRDNIQLIKQCNMQILMANNILQLIEEQLSLIKEDIVEDDTVENNTKMNTDINI
jgi:hypothetical protein